MSRSTAAVALMTIVLLGACGDVVQLTAAPASPPPATTAGSPTVTDTPRPLPEPSVAPESPGAPDPDPESSPPSAEPPRASPAESPPPPPPPPPPAPPTEPPPTPPGGEGLAPQLVGVEMEVLPTDEKVVALTFDAGANADGIPSILATLHATGVRGTFFLTGAWVERYPELAAQIGSEYPVANHSFTHPAFTTLSDEQIRDEVTRTNDVILAATGQDTRPIFRFPFGDRDERTTRLVNELGYANIRWTVDTLGWKGTTGGMTAELVHQRVLDGLRPGAIVMMHVGSHPHDGSTLDADALPVIIEAITAAGYRFVTLDEYL